jgi:selenide,water dikinase
MAVASGVTLAIESASVPLLPGALNAARAGAIPGGLKNNLDFASCAVETAGEIDPALLQLLYDPQTSGGLLIALPEDEAGALKAAISGSRRIGRVIARDNKPIRIE